MCSLDIYRYITHAYKTILRGIIVYITDPYTRVKATLVYRAVHRTMGIVIRAAAIAKSLQVIFNRPCADHICI